MAGNGGAHGEEKAVYGCLRCCNSVARRLVPVVSHGLATRHLIKGPSRLHEIAAIATTSGKHLHNAAVYSGRAISRCPYRQFTNVDSAQIALAFALTLALAFLAVFFTFFAMLFTFAFTVFAPDLMLALAALTSDLMVCVTVFAATLVIKRLATSTAINFFM